MIVLKISVEDGASKGLGELARQVPYAVATAINESLRAAQVKERQHIHEAFTVRRRDGFINRQVRLSPFATKQTLTGVLGIDPIRDLLSKFELGGQKVSASGKALTVPVAVRRTKAGLVVANLRVRNLQLRAHRSKTGAVQLKGRFRTFSIKNAKGGAILQRVGKKARGSSISEELSAGSLRLLWLFRRSVPIPASLHFEQIVSETVTRGWPAAWDKAWSRAVATAR